MTKKSGLDGERDSSRLSMGEGSDDPTRSNTAGSESNIVTRKFSRSWLTLGLVALVIILAAVTPSPFAIEKPGPVVDALGEIKTDTGSLDVVKVSGAETFPSKGSLNVLSVSLFGTPQDPMHWLSLVGAFFNRSWAIVRIADLYPDGVTADDRTAQNEAMMLASQQDATAAALQQLNLPVTGTVTVTAVSKDGPSNGVLRDGDVIRTAAGESVTGVGGLRNLVKDHSGAQPVSLGIERDGKPMTVQVMAAVPEGAPANADPMLGIGVSSDFKFPFDVDLELDTIGGPSAGLVFALAIYDELTPGALTKGLDVSGTGTIDDAGNVGAIGGLPQKIWGASEAGSDLLLIPVSNCADVPKRLPSDMTIAPVASLDEAIDAVEAAASGGTVAGLEQCVR